MKALLTLTLVSFFAISCAHQSKSCDTKKSCSTEKKSHCKDKKAKSCELKKDVVKTSCCSKKMN